MMVPFGNRHGVFGSSSRLLASRRGMRLVGTAARVTNGDWTAASVTGIAGRAGRFGIWAWQGRTAKGRRAIARGILKRVPVVGEKGESIALGSARSPGREGFQCQS